jgi:cyclopropane fatty-acyl-phospholipid synthase-like methyltransferase
MKKIHNFPPFSFYKEYPKTCDPKDFWSQVKRTVNGKPVSAKQIRMIVTAVRNGLQLEYSDTLLDLCCGNGALTDLLFNYCRGGVGVDFSEYLINVAKSNFELHPYKIYKLCDITDFLRNTSAPTRFTKILCYGSFAYLDTKRAKELLSLCNERFPSASTLFIGNLPDKSQLNAFYVKNDYTPGIEDEPDSPIGKWRTKEEFQVLAENVGWDIQFRTMPKTFYASKYRFDAILTRRKKYTF